MLIHTELFSNVSGLGLMHCGLGLEKIFGFGPRPRPHSFWPRPHAQLASFTSLLRRSSDHIMTLSATTRVRLLIDGSSVVGVQQL